MVGIYGKDYFDLMTLGSKKWGISNCHILPVPDGWALYPNGTMEKHAGIEAPIAYWEDLATYYYSAFVVKFRTVYQVRLSTQGFVVLQKVYYKQPCDGVPIMGRSRWSTFTGKRLNELLGISLFYDTEILEK